MARLWGASQTLAVHGVQFHPESILTEHGHDLLANFLKVQQPDHTQQALTRLIEQREIFTTRCYPDASDHERRCVGSNRLPYSRRPSCEKRNGRGISAAAQVMREFSTKVPVLNREHLVIPAVPGAMPHTLSYLYRQRFGSGCCGCSGGQTWRALCILDLRSADVLEALGVNLNLLRKQVGQCVDKIGIGLCLRPIFMAL